MDVLLERRLHEFGFALGIQNRLPNAGPMLIRRARAFINRAEEHPRRCGSHCWVRTGILEIEDLLSKGNVIVSPNGRSFAFGQQATRQFLISAIKVTDGVRYNHIQGTRRCPLPFHWDYHGNNPYVYIPAEMDADNARHFASVGDEGYHSDNGEA